MAAPGNGQPTNGDGIPDIPVTSFRSQAQQQTEGWTLSGTFAKIWAYLWASIWPGILCAISWFAGHFDEILSKVVQVFGALQATDQPGFYDMTASIMEDLLGFPVSGAEMRAASRKGGAIAGARVIGQKLVDQLRRELETTKEVTPDSGVAAANAFIGFCMGFAIRQGNVDFFSEILPEQIDVIKGLRGYGEEMAKQLGLGRLSRRALQPLVQTLVADPLTWKLNSQYHPTKLGTSEALRLVARRAISEDLFQQEMDYSGLRKEYSEPLREAAYTQFSASQIHSLFKWSAFDETTWERRAVAAGYNLGDMRILQRLSEIEDADSDVQSMKALLKTQLLAGDISLDEFQTKLDELPLAQEEKDRFSQLIYATLAKPRAKLTLAQVESAVVEGILDITDMQDWLNKQGYSDDDALTLQYITLAKLSGSAEKKRVAQFKYDKQVKAAEKKGEPIPPPPAILAQ